MSDELAGALAAAGFALIETHISHVFLREADVYKTKRAVNFGFLDFSTLAQRERACQAEVALNRRLAPDVYLGVVAIVRAADGALAFRPQRELGGEPVLEWAVHMRRLRDEDRADLLLARGEFGVRDVEEIAALLVRFHRAARSDELTASFGRPDAIAGNVEENFAQIEASMGAYLAPSESAELANYQRAYLRAERSRFERRAAAGFVRDGHGDLRLEHLYRSRAGGYLAIDCIEFNDRFRYADVCADLAFLGMDLAYHGRIELAELLIAKYAEESADYGLYALLDFYESYRAVVRAKVASILADDASVAADTRERARHEARRYYLLAISAGRRRLAPPRLIVTFGMIASGKSTLATALAERLGLAVLCADRMRKQLLGEAPTTAHHDAAFDGAYAPERTEQVYRTLFERAEQVLGSGRSVVLDATFRARAQRAGVRELAERAGVEAVFFEARCGRETSLARLRQRAAGPSVSDGREEIFDAFAAEFEAPSELSTGEHVVLDTEQSPEQTLAQALRRLG